MAAGDPVAELDTRDRGLDISKEVVTDGQHAQVEVEIFSTHGDPVDASIEEPLPEGTAPTQIGFLPDHEPDDAQVTDHGTFRLEADLDPWVVSTIIYGIKNVGNVNALAEEPQVVAIEGPDGQDLTEAVGESADDPAGEETADAAAQGAIEPVNEDGTEPTSQDGVELASEDGTEATGWATESNVSSERTDGLDDPAIENSNEPETGRNRATQAGNRTGRESSEIHEQTTQITETDDGDTDDGLIIDRYEDLVPAKRSNPGGGEDGESSLDLPLDDQTAKLLAAQLSEHMDSDVRQTGNLSEFDAQIAALEETATELETQLAAVQEQLDELESWREAVAAASRQE